MLKILGFAKLKNWQLFLIFSRLPYSGIEYSFWKVRFRGGICCMDKLDLYHCSGQLSLVACGPFDE
jgi:hypothetical protein